MYYRDNIVYGKNILYCIDGTDISDIKHDYPLFVNNIGFSKIDENYTLNRANGRSDYQLIHIIDGILTIKINNKLIDVEKDNIIIFKPFEPQVFSVKKNIICRYNWFHFSGPDAKPVLEKLNLTSLITPVENSSELKAIFKKMLPVCLTNDVNEVLLCAYALEFLSKINYNTKYSPRRYNKALELIITSGIYSTKELAKTLQISEEHFIRTFKSDFGITPNKFITNARMEKAKRLLLDTDMKIADVSRSCGYDDPLYFSKVFKKNTGLSPKDFKISHNFIE